MICLGEIIDRLKSSNAVKFLFFFKNIVLLIQKKQSNIAVLIGHVLDCSLDNHYDAFAGDDQLIRREQNYDNVTETVLTNFWKDGCRKEDAGRSVHAAWNLESAVELLKRMSYN